MWVHRDEGTQAAQKPWALVGRQTQQWGKYNWPPLKASEFCLREVSSSLVWQFRGEVRVESIKGSDQRRGRKIKGLWLMKRIVPFEKSEMEGYPNGVREGGGI